MDDELIQLRQLHALQSLDAQHLQQLAATIQRLQAHSGTLNDALLEAHLLALNVLAQAAQAGEEGLIHGLFADYVKQTLAQVSHIHHRLDSQTTELLQAIKTAFPHLLNRN